MVPDDPMSLDKLPKYLKSKKALNKTPVLSMGQITKPRINWTKISAIVGTSFLLFGLVVAISYNTITNKNITVLVNTNNISQEEIISIVSNQGGRVVEVKENKNAVYEIKVSIKKNINTFLNLLRENKDVKSVDLE